MLNLRTLVQKLVPVHYRRTLKDRLGMPRWLHDNYALLRRIGPFEDAHVVLDIGACNGWFTECWLEYCPGAVVHCFEPSAETYARTLSRRLGGRSGVTLNNVGVGDAAGTATLHTGASYASNSFYDLKPSNELGLELGNTEQVPVIRLADYLQQHGIGPIRLVKIDVQGHELPVLHGFGDRLAAVDYLYIEVSIHPLYEQPATLCGVLDYLRERGFLVMDLKPNSLDGRYVQEADVLFVRESLLIPE